MNCKLSVVALTLAVTVSGVWAQASAEKKVLSARILQAQKPNIEAMARTLADERWAQRPRQAHGVRVFDLLRDGAHSS